MTTFHIITLFPDAFDSYLGESILKRAIDDKKIKVKFYNPRDFAVSKGNKSGDKKKSAAMTYAERRVDNRPYGGGPGMVIEALPVIKAIAKAIGKGRKGEKKREKKKFSGSLSNTQYRAYIQCASPVLHDIGPAV